MSSSRISFDVHEFGFGLRRWLTPQPGGRRVYAHLWCGVIDLKWGDKKLAVSVYAEAETNVSSSELKHRWMELIRCGSAVAIQKGVVKPFHRNNLFQYLPDESVDVPSPSAVPVTETYLAELDEAYELDQKARRSFDIALERARSLGQHFAQPGERNGPYAMLSFLQRSLDAGDPNPFNRVDGSNSDLDAARTFMSDLGRRKNTRHEGYTSSQESVSWHLTGLHPPIAFCDNPPCLDAELLR
jgi:hypothetical protein